MLSHFFSDAYSALRIVNTNNQLRLEPPAFGLHVNTDLTMSMLRAFRAFGRFSVRMPQVFCSLTRTIASESEVDDMALPRFKWIDLPGMNNAPLGKRVNN